MAPQNHVSERPRNGAKLTPGGVTPWGLWGARDEDGTQNDPQAEIGPADADSTPLALWGPTHLCTNRRSLSRISLVCQRMRGCHVVSNAPKADGGPAAQWAITCLFKAREVA
jgi:hypothetical protein